MPWSRRMSQQLMTRRSPSGLIIDVWAYMWHVYCTICGRIGCVTGHAVHVGGCHPDGPRVWTWNPNERRPAGKDSERCR